jgi:hypothetical protein
MADAGRPVARSDSCISCRYARDQALRDTVNINI